VEPAERALKDITHRHVLPPFPLGRMAQHRLVHNTRPRPNSYTASLHPGLPRSLPSTPAWSYTRLGSIFMSMGGPQAHAKLLP